MYQEGERFRNCSAWGVGGGANNVPGRVFTWEDQGVEENQVILKNKNIKKTINTINSNNTLISEYHGWETYLNINFIFQNFVYV